MRSPLSSLLSLIVFAIIVISALNTHARENNIVSPSVMVQAHNHWRSEVGSPNIHWSPELEAKASRWAKTLQQKGCALIHSGPGENLYWASGKKSADSKDEDGNWIWRIAAQNISAKDVVNSWAMEKQWYEYSNNTCKPPKGQSCGHYTQLIWADSTGLGCAMAQCDDQSQVWVCNYSPAGNLVGQKPY